MTAVILFIYGAIAGSFLNVAGTRWNSGLTLAGRSACPVCGKSLRWFELFPVASFFFLRGRCTECRARISWQYPLVEIWTGLVFATVYNLQFPIFDKILLLVVFSVYIIIAIYDHRHKIIPDALVYSAIVLALGLRVSESVWGGGFGILDWTAGPVLFLFFAAIWLFSRGRAMGFGDAKLALSLGLLLGAAQGFSAAVLACWIGAAAGIAGMIFSRKKITMKSEMPFAPFLIIGGWLSLIWSLDLLHVSLF